MNQLSSISGPCRFESELPRRKHRGSSVFPDPSFLAAAASGAMAEELGATPKPGLVDRLDSGSHTDMDFQSFSRSIRAIRPFFSEVVRAASVTAPSPELFERLREIGLRTEAAMFLATGGINTHKGQIFVMILLLASLVCSFPCPDPDTVQANVRKLASGIVLRDFHTAKGKGEISSHGEILYHNHGIRGVRGEAEKGFPIIFQRALPVFSSLVSAGYSRNTAAVETLLHIMSHLEDTTIIHRGGHEALKLMHERSGEALGYGAVRTEAGRRYLRTLNRYFIAKHLSPGGCADLLAGTIFIHNAFLMCRGKL